MRSGESFTATLAFSAEPRYFAGTRVPVQALIDYLEAGRPLAEFLDDFPTVTHNQAKAVLEPAKDALTSDPPPALMNVYWPAGGGQLPAGAHAGRDRGDAGTAGPRSSPCNRSRISRSCRAGLARGISGQVGGVRRRTQYADQALVLRGMESQIGRRQVVLFRAGDLACDQFIEVGQPGAVVEGAQVGLDYARPHQVNAGQEHAIHVQQRLDPGWLLALKQLPLPRGEALIVTRVTAGHAIGASPSTPRAPAWCVRSAAIALLQHVPVGLEQ